MEWASRGASRAARKYRCLNESEEDSHALPSINTPDDYQVDSFDL